jgi:S1-C subfamily serine protease
VTVELAQLPELELSFSQSYDKNVDSIVTVHVVDEYGMSQGTGIVLTRDGYIITNAHVVEDAFVAQVVLSNDAIYEAALVGCSIEEDLAVLKISAQDLKPAEFGDSDLLKVGDGVSVLGSPLGYRMTLTSGIVSAVDRELEIDGVSMYLLQTDAAINFGNSGGALFNDRGQVVGVTTAKIMSSDGSTEALGFAIPTRRVRYVVDQLIAGEEIKTPAMGITVEFNPAVEGLTVLKIEDWSDAAEQGLQVGDVIHAVAGQQVRTTRDLERIKNLHKVGERLILDVERDGGKMVFAVLLKDWDLLYGDAG